MPGVTGERSHPIMGSGFPSDRPGRSVDEGVGMNRYVSAVSVAAALIVLGASPARADTTVHGKLMPENRSGVHGTVSLTARDDGALEVSVEARGLIPGPHAQHIHGHAGGGRLQCATMRDDEDGDGWLTNEEATGEYGQVTVSLTTRGSTSATSGLALDRMPVADAEGRMSYRRTIPAGRLPRGLVENLAHVHVVVHGVDANDNGRYDLRGLGESTFAKNLGVSGVPEEATNPTACAVVMGASAGHMPTGGVETGGAPPAGRPGLMALLGVGLLSLASWFAVRGRARTRRRVS